MHNYIDLNVWKKNMDLEVDIYSITESLPESEKFNFISQPIDVRYLCLRILLKVPGEIPKRIFKDS